MILKNFQNKVLRFIASAVWFFRTKPILIGSLMDTHDQVGLLRSMVLSSRNLEELQGRFKDIDLQPKLLNGQITGDTFFFDISHWSTRIFVNSFQEVLKSCDAKNYVEIKFGPTIAMNEPDFLIDAITVTIQKHNGLTPADKIRLLEEEVKRLKGYTYESDQVVS